MTQEQYEECTPEAVRGLHHGASREQNHLVDEIQHPETEEALELMALRFAPPAPEPQPKTGVTW